MKNKILAIFALAVAISAPAANTNAPASFTPPAAAPRVLVDKVNLAHDELTQFFFVRDPAPFGPPPAITTNGAPYAAAAVVILSGGGLTLNSNASPFVVSSTLAQALKIAATTADAGTMTTNLYLLNATLTTVGKTPVSL